jgi:hypothetical protein
MLPKMTDCSNKWFVVLFLASCLCPLVRNAIQNFSLAKLVKLYFLFKFKQLEVDGRGAASYGEGMF